MLSNQNKKESNSKKMADIPLPEIKFDLLDHNSLGLGPEFDAVEKDIEGY
jgi:hypothetical protein